MIKQAYRNAFFASIFCLLSFNSLAAGGYTPSTSTQKSIETFTVNKDGSYREDNETLTRIETEQGVQNNGDKDISYIPDLEDVKIQAAYTILPDGSRIQVPEKNIHTTNDDLLSGGAMYSDMKHKMVIYPNVVAGSQLYLKYTKIRHVPLFAGHFAYRKIALPFWKYGYCEVNFIFDPKIHLKLDARGFEGSHLADERGMRHERFVFRQDAFVESEPNQVSASDFAPYVLASTFANYEALGKAYQDKTKDKVKVTPALKQLADELTRGADDQKAQARLLYNWVSKNIRYVGSYIGNGGYVPHDAQTILDNKWGDCKDHVVILETLLAAKNIESSAVLIHSGNAYVLPKLAGVYAFNHAITYVPSLDLYLDSTDRFAPFGILPMGDLDKQVLLTGLNKMGKTPTMKAQEQAIQTVIVLNVMSDGKIQGGSKIHSSGNKEIALRGRRFNDQNSPQERVINTILSGANLSGVGEIHSTDPTDLDKPLEINASFTLDTVSNVPGPAAMPIPPGVAFGVLNARMIPKPKEKINFPLNCESVAYRNDYEIEFPANVQIRHIPDNVDYDDGVLHYTAKYTLNGNKLEVSRNLASQHPTMVCDVSENERVKRFFPVFQRDMRAQVIYE